MKSLRISLYLTALVIAALIFALHPCMATFFGAAICVFAVGNALAPASDQLCVTFSTTVLLADVMEAFKVRFPMLFGAAGFGTDFSDGQARYNDQIIAKIRTLPSVQSYDATNGFEPNNAEASALVVDVPVTLDQFKHVPVKVDFLDQIASRIDLYNGCIDDMVFTLGKSVVDFALGKIVAANFSYGANLTISNTSKTGLDAATMRLNINGASPAGRFGIVSSAFYNALEEDARISSGDYYGAARSDNAYGMLQNLAGFSRIFEYPAFPANAENLNAFFGVRTAIALASRIPSDPSKIAAANGIPQIAKFETLTDPGSGLTLLGIMWQKSGTFDIWLTVAVLYGGAAGKQAGNAGTICDKAGYRITENGGVYA